MLFFSFFFKNPNKEHNAILRQITRVWNRYKRRYVTDKDGQLLQDTSYNEANKPILLKRNEVKNVLDSRAYEGDIDKNAAAEAASSFIFNHLSSHFAVVESLRAKMSQPYGEILTSNMLLEKEIRPAVKEEISQLRGRIRFAIYCISQAIEAKRLEENEKLLSHFPTNSPEMKRIEKLFDGEFALHSSYRSAALSGKIFSIINRKLREEIIATERDNRTAKLQILVIRSTVLICEMLDVIIGQLKHFQLNGEDILKDLSQEIEDELRSSEQADRELQLRLSNELDNYPDSASVENNLKSIENNIKNREFARALTRRKWSELMNKIENSKDKIGQIQKRIEILELNRQNAENQLALLQTAFTVIWAEKGIKAIDDLMDIKNLDLDIIEPKDYKSFLNIDDLTSPLPSSDEDDDQS